MVSNLLRFSWLPVPVLLLTVCFLRLAEPQFVYDSRSLLLLLNFLFLTLPFGLVAVLLARSFLTRPNLAMVAFGCGSLLWCGASIFSPLAMSHSPNAVITIYNTLVFVSAFCHLAGATLAQMPQRDVLRPRLVLTAAYAVAAGVVWLVVHGTLQEGLPVFFVPGQGGTPVRQAILSATVAMFAGSAALLRFAHRRAPSSFVHWYCLGLLLVATGLFGVMLQTMSGSLLNWMSRAAQMLGGVYILLAALGSLRESGGWIVLDAEKWDFRLMRMLTPQWFMELPAGWRYAVAVGMAMAATTLRWAVIPLMGTEAPYIIFVVATVVTSLLGFGPALLSIFLGIIGIEVFVLQELPVFTVATMVRVVITLFAGIIIAALLHVIRVAVSQARKNAERLATFAAATFEGIIEAKAGEILDCNEQLGQLLGYQVEELKGMQIADLVAPEDRDRVLSIIRNGKESIIENEMLRMDGTRVTVEAHGRPVGHGDIRHTAIRDITDRRRREEDLKTLNDELERRVEQRTFELQAVRQQYLHAEKLSAIGKLSASIAHEFNSPLQSVMTVLKGLKKTAGLGGGDLQMLELAIGESERMKNLIRSLRDFNRPSSGRKTFFYVQEAIESILTLTKSDYGKKKIAVTTDFSPHLPQILAVPDQFKQVLLNLLTNAIDACAGSGGEIKIRGGSPCLNNNQHFLGGVSAYFKLPVRQSAASRHTPHQEFSYPTVCLDRLYHSRYCISSGLHRPNHRHASTPARISPISTIVQQKHCPARLHAHPY